VIQIGNESGFATEIELPQYWSKRGARRRPMLAIGGSLTEVKSRRPRLVVGWVTSRENRALLTCVYIAVIVLT
jgi:hypothetical protein